MNKYDLLDELAALYRARRLELGLTKLALARRSGVHRMTILQLENGSALPALHHLAALTGSLGIPFSQLAEILDRHTHCAPLRGDGTPGPAASRPGS